MLKPTIEAKPMNTTRPTHDAGAITINSSTSTTLTGTAIDLYRYLTIAQGLKLLIKTDGRMRLTRSATPSALLRLVTESTGKKCPNSRQGWASALASIESHIQALQASVTIVDNTSAAARG